MRRTILCLALVPQLALAAETPLSGAEFEAYTTGRTLTFASRGQVYGAEQYLPGRRVKWAFTEDVCREGIWYEDAGQICFVYDYDPTPQCWIFWQDGGLRARFTSADSGTELQEVENSTAPLPCAGPEVGV